MKECPQVSVFRCIIVSSVNAENHKIYERFLEGGLQQADEVRFYVRFSIGDAGANTKTNERGRVDRGKGA